MASKKIELIEIKRWLIAEFSYLRIIERVFLVGSILHKPRKEVNDIDIVQLLRECTKDDLIKHSEKVKIVRKMFLTDFGKSLHIVSFTQNEIVAFQKFMSLNEKIEII